MLDAEDGLADPGSARLGFCAVILPKPYVLQARTMCQMDWVSSRSSLCRANKAPRRGAVETSFQKRLMYRQQARHADPEHDPWQAGRLQISKLRGIS